MKVRIEIDTKTFVRFWLVVIVFGLAGLAIYSAKDALILLGVSLFLALALNRPVAIELLVVLVLGLVVVGRVFWFGLLAALGDHHLDGMAHEFE